MNQTEFIEEESTTWPELLGSKNWEHLTNPLNINLRKLILRCGDFCQATHDAFNNDQNSKFCGTSRYGPNSLFKNVCLYSGSDYQIVSFLYATAKVSVPEAFLLKSQSRESWDRESNWIGYIAITNDDVSKSLNRREIYVAWRGTTRTYEWINVLGAKLESVHTLLQSKAIKSITKEGDGDTSDIDKDEEEDDGDDEEVPKVMRGWLAMYVSDDPKSPFTKTSVRTQLLTKIKELINQYRDENLSLIFTGHSLGASLSVLSAFDIAENIEIPNIPIAAFVFGCPQVGNKAFNKKLTVFPNVHVMHIRNKIDLIPHYPSKLLGYVDTGIELVIDTRKSPSLKDSKNPSDWHNLQAMLHIVAGWNGEDEEFEFKVKRSLALVNKSSDFLKEECLVPAAWWVEKNRGMVLGDDGEWGLPSPDDEDLPVPPET